MLNQDALWEANKARHRELLAVAQTQRLLKVKTERRNRRLNRKDRILAYMGDFLIVLGSRLKAQHAPITQ